MYVIKRDGRHEPVHFDKITSRLQKLCYGLDASVDPVLVAQKVVQGVYKGVSTEELDILAAETAAHMSTDHYDYDALAARIEVSNLHKSTSKNIVDLAEQLYANTNQNGLPAPLISESLLSIIRNHGDTLNGHIIHDRDFEYTYFGFKTLCRSYLLRMDGKIMERPQHMLMRVALGIHGTDITKALESYELMSLGFFTHASPTLFNAGTPRPQLSSCFLLTTRNNDSIEGIYNTLKSCALISKYAGGIGIACQYIRPNGSYIQGTNGYSSGLIPMLRVYNNTARYVNQGGRRNGSFAIYIEPWHADILEFLQLKKNHGVEEERARDLFYGLWVNDLFMERVEADADWSLFCPNRCPLLPKTYGQEFKAAYEAYEAQGMQEKVLKARTVWQAILEAQMETGTPYMMYKDAVNQKSNQKNIGVIDSSNLCTEIVEYTDENNVSVCNLASIALPKFVEDGKFQFDKLFEITQVVLRNLNRIIDINFYPIPEAKRSNLAYRPVGIGVQGLQNTFFKLKLPFDSPEARQLNKDIFETLQFAAWDASCRLAEEEGAYSAFQGSPISEGKFQHDLWNVCPSSRWDWSGLEQRVSEHGTRNSLCTAPMPTASTAQILGNTECFEPITSLIYVRRTLAGEFVMICKELIQDLIERQLWSPALKDRIVAANGSIQNILEIPDDLKLLYRNVWEIPQKSIIDMAADRGAFIDQSQSMNIHMMRASSAKLTSMHFYAWKKGLKTGMYYLRTKAAADAQKTTIAPDVIREIACSLDNAEACVSCGA